MLKKGWFDHWFDSPYYHRLYKNRDENEARAFIQKLVQFIEPAAQSTALDLACGKGRHAVTLHESGLDVTGVDLSKHSIQCAQAVAKQGLAFAVHDMRLPYKIEHFDYVFNLFTSFGYFETKEEDQHVIEAVHQSLKKGGTFLFDFFNAAKVIKHLVPEERITRDNIDFHIQRYTNEGCIHKKIRFEADNQPFEFEERVRAYTHSDIKELLLANGFEIIHTFGSYQLDPFNEDASDRLVVLSKKHV